MRWLGMVLAAGVLLGAMSVEAEAKGKPEAREAYRRGTQYYNLGEFARALDEFKQAYLDFADPVFLFNIAQCHRQLGQKKEAALAYRSYLREQPDSPQRADVEGKIATLEQQVKDEEEAARQRASAAAALAASPKPPPAVDTAAVVRAAPVARPPLYKKWWLWTAVAGGVVVVGAVALGVAFGARRTHYPSTSVTDGTVGF